MTPIYIYPISRTIYPPKSQIYKGVECTDANYKKQDKKTRFVLKKMGQNQTISLKTPIFQKKIYSIFTFSNLQLSDIT